MFVHFAYFSITDTNVLCGRCSEGFSHVGSDCKDCNSAAVTSNWILFVLGSLFWTAFLLFVAAFPSSTAKKKIFFYFVQTLKIVVGPTSSWWVFIFFFVVCMCIYIVCCIVFICISLVGWGFFSFSILLSFFLFFVFFLSRK